MSINNENTPELTQSNQNIPVSDNNTNFNPTPPQN